MIQIERTGKTTITPDPDEVIAAIQEIENATELFQPEARLYALFYSAIAQGICRDLKMDKETLIRLLDLLYEDTITAAKDSHHG